MRIEFGAVILGLVSVCVNVSHAESTTVVPAIITFGDSVVDVGNNDYFRARFKANYPPYGRDFINHNPTGRFCDGKLATDLTADTLGFTQYPPAYLSPEATGKNLLLGANFGSAGSGYDHNTSAICHAISLSQQLEYYKEYQGKLAKVAGSKRANTIIKEALYIVGYGSGDFIQNYYVNPNLNKVYSPPQYSSYLATLFSKLITSLYALGARKIGVTSLPPLGCLPATKSLFGHHRAGCIARINADAQGFNKKLNSTASRLKKKLSGLNVVIFDIYKPLYDLVQTPSASGFTEAGKACCRTGTKETALFLCNPGSIGTCRNASQYVFWDNVHPTQAANQVVADALVLAGIGLVV